MGSDALLADEALRLLEQDAAHGGCGASLEETRALLRHVRALDAELDRLRDYIHENCIDLERERDDARAELQRLRAAVGDIICANEADDLQAAIDTASQLLTPAAAQKQEEP